MKVKVSKKIEDEFFKAWLRRRHNTTSWYDNARKRGVYANLEFYELALYYYALGRKQKRGEKKGGKA